MGEIGSSSDEILEAVLSWCVIVSPHAVSSRTNRFLSEQDFSLFAWDH